MVGQDEVGAQVRVLVAGEGVAGLFSKIEVDAANGQVHRRQAPGGRVGLLPIDRHVAQLAAVGLDEFLGLHEHAARAAARVVHLAAVRDEDGDQRLDDARRGVELPAALAFGAGEHAKEVFIHLAQRVAGHAGRVVKTDGGHQVHQLAEFAVGATANGRSACPGCF